MSTAAKKAKSPSQPKNEMTTQGRIEMVLVGTLKAMAVRKGSGMISNGYGASTIASCLLGKAATLHQGKAELRLIRMGYDGRIARRIVEDCAEVAVNEACIELGI